MGGRIDIKQAFHNLPIHSDDLHLLGFTLQGKHYINSSLPFGAASSCAIFEKVASALQWVITNETGCHLLPHYLDNFPLLEHSRDKLLSFMNSFFCILHHIGMPVVPEKTLGPTQYLPHLGLALDFEQQLLAILEGKRLKCTALVAELLTAYHHQHKTTVKKIQWVAGSLNFICQALLARKPFPHSLYSLTRTVTGSK